MRRSCSSTLSRRNTTLLRSSFSLANPLPRTLSAGVPYQEAPTTSGNSRASLQSCSHFMGPEYRRSAALESRSRRRARSKGPTRKAKRSRSLVREGSPSPRFFDLLPRIEREVAHEMDGFGGAERAGEAGCWPAAAIRQVLCVPAQHPASAIRRRIPMRAGEKLSAAGRGQAAAGSAAGDGDAVAGLRSGGRCGRGGDSGNGQAVAVGAGLPWRGGGTFLPGSALAIPLSDGDA